ncbi:NCS2 family permease [Desulfovibrio cuneatus]|uniref:NCS2 family permease n=1 Tax=Desulfovibrio cuneatus TaxID=159728 RepID=UPI00041A2361|nr:NCS2 family permease [Desulfovibrio cuneatus]
MSGSTFESKVDQFFGYSARGSSFGTEVRAGLTTFATMAYILPVNMAILSQAGLDGGAVFMATALSAVLGTVLMALLARLPFALAPGMGLNAFFAFTVVLGMGKTPAFALAAVFTEGVVFIFLSLTGVRTALFNAIPKEIKQAVSAGIGLFIMFIGLQNCGFIVADKATLVAINPHLNSAAVALAIIGIGLTIVLYLRRVKGALLLGILGTWGLGMLAQAAGWYVVNPQAGHFSLFPGGVFSAPPSLAPTFGLFLNGFAEAFASGANFGQFLLVIMTFLYVDIFDTLGTLSGVATKANMLDKNGNLPGITGALSADAIATVAGAMLGTSTVTTFVESSAGVEEGGRTGLTAIVTAVCFFLAIFMFPVVGAIPAFATTCALFMVGIMMFEPLKDLEFNNPECLIPAVITVAFMVMGYSISAGLMWGVLAFILVKVAVGKPKEITPLIWSLGVIFLLKLFVLDTMA